MTSQNKTIIATVAIPLMLILLPVSYKAFKDQQMINDMKSVLAQSKVVDIDTLSSSGTIGFAYPVFLIPPINSIGAYFNFNSCCSEQQFAKSSRKFYKAGTTTEDGHTYNGLNSWSGILGNYLPSHLEQGSFGDAEVKVRGKLYNLTVVNDTKAKKTTIIIFPPD